MLASSPMTVEPSVGRGKTRANARVDANASEASATLPFQPYRRLLPGSALTIISSTPAALQARIVEYWAGSACCARHNTQAVPHDAVGATARSERRPALR